MPNPWRGPFPWLLLAFAVQVLMTVGAAFFLNKSEGGSDEFTALTLISVAGASIMFAVAWKVVDFHMLRRLRRLAAEVRATAHGGNRVAVDSAQFAVLSPLPEAVNELTARMAAIRAELAEGLAGATHKAEETSARLAAILNDLHEAVVVCNQRHQIVLYNSVAMEMLGQTGPLGLGRSLFETVSRDAVLHMLDMLSHRTHQDGRGVPFLAGTQDGTMLLQARMTLIRDPDGGNSGYVITMVDAGPQVTALAQRDALLRGIGETLEGPVLRLSMAADNPVLVAQEAQTISTVLRAVGDGYRRALSGWWPMADLHSGDFFGLVARRFADGHPQVTVTGLPVWLHVDSHSLALAVESLIRRISDRFGLDEVDLAASLGEDGAFVEIGWAGATAARPALADWLALPLAGLGGMTVRDVLAHHAGDAVRQEHRNGRSWLMLPMPPGVEVGSGQPKSDLPTRPEFYDLSLLDSSRDVGELGRQPLRSLTFVVFDTETTGLNPAQGDQIVQIGGVRVVNGRILSGESFNRIVNPGRPIPPDSIRFHGITDDMARDKPPIGVILPQFKSFTADAVLVAHNAAFDLKFLRMREQDMGVRFDNPVLDTMMISSYLDGAEAGHSLDDICARLGISITDRHTALGDAIVTAAVLLRQIDMLEARGITTLDQVVKELDINVQLQQRQRALEGAKIQPQGW